MPTMSRLRLPLLALALLATQAALAQPPLEKRELIYCADRMSHEEREAYRAKMRAARTLEEREQLRAAHRAEMQARAAGQGNAIDCEPRGHQFRGGRGK